VRGRLLEQIMKNFQTLFEEAVEEIKAFKSADRFYSTGFGKLDKILGGGLMKPSTTIVGGRPGTGKTTFVNQIVNHLTKTYPEAVVFYFSLEMHPVMQMKKFMSLEFCMTLEEINAQDEASLREKSKELIKRKILMYDDATSMESAISERIKLWKSLHLSFSPVVVLDHSRLWTRTTQKNEKEKLDSLSFKMMEIKKKFSSVNIVISQLNRTSEQEGYKNPTQADIYGSDALVQDADSVVLLSKLKPPTTFKNVVVETDDFVAVHVVKNRFGPEDKFLLYSQLEINRFAEV
jgi:replicative DNA helicase